MQYPPYFPVNWVDGMKLNKSHFMAQHHASTWLGARSLSSLLHDDNYGLLPQTGNSSENGISVAIDGRRHINITMHSCRAITPGGHLIEFDRTLLQYNNIPIKEPAISFPLNELRGAPSGYYVVVVVHPYERLAYGKADPEETPLRLPYSIPSYTLQLIPVSDAGKHALGDYHLPVAKLIVEDQKVLLDEDYIPPCSTISSHAGLLQKHAELNQFLGRMEAHALQIILKITQKQKQNDVSPIVQKLCEHILVFTASAIMACRCVHTNQPPAFLYSTAGAFARLLKNSFDQYTGTGKDNLMVFFKNHCQTNQSDLEEAIASLLNEQYNHADMYGSFAKASQFIKVVTTLFNHLVKLEFIGAQHDTGILVHEKAPVAKTGPSFIA